MKIKELEKGVQRSIKEISKAVFKRTRDEIERGGFDPFVCVSLTLARTGEQVVVSVGGIKTMGDCQSRDAFILAALLRNAAEEIEQDIPVFDRIDAESALRGAKIIS